MSWRVSSLSVLALMSMTTSAFSVTPGSPCTSVCRPDATPKSSSTSPNDALCNIRELRHDPLGKVLEACLTCLQESTYSKGDESDQFWFLQNMRDSLKHCLFESGLGSSYCTTSAACNAMEEILVDNDVGTATRSSYDFCEGNDSASLPKSFGQCFECLDLGSEHRHLANYLVALEAGCQHRPENGDLLGLNDTVFSDYTISLVDSASPSAKTAANDAPLLSVPIIAGIAAGGSVLLLLVAGCIYMQCRKRKAQQKRRPGSSLSFQCQTHLTPKSPNFPVLRRSVTKGHQKLHASEPVVSKHLSRWSLWRDSRAQAEAPVPPTTEAEKEDILRHNPKANLSLSTTALPNRVPKSYSPQTAKSPADEFVTPTSTTSTRSTTALIPHLPAITPKGYATLAHDTPPPPVPSMTRYLPNTNHHDPTTYAKSFEPRHCEKSWPLQDEQSFATDVPTSAWERPAQRRQESHDRQQQQQQQQFHSQGATTVTYGNEQRKPPVRQVAQDAPAKWNGRPTETKTVQTSFPPPPKGRRR